MFMAMFSRARSIRHARYLNRLTLDSHLPVVALHPCICWLCSPSAGKGLKCFDPANASGLLCFETLVLSIDGATGVESCSTLHRKADLLENQRLSCSLSDMKARIMAISRSMASIEFSPDGIILNANENFCRVMGYTADEPAANTTEFFCEDAYQRSNEYAQFWRDLARGEAQNNTFVRLNKAGRSLA